MAKQVKSWTEEMTVQEPGGETSARVRYACDMSEDPLYVKYGELEYTVVDANTVTEEKAAILAAIKTAEGIA